jgi:HK97 family phage prohead protease/HK97 family phage major capsid protein
MPMKPRKGEDQSTFMARCVPDMVGTGESKRPQEQAVAICLDIWRQAHGGKKPPKKEGAPIGRAVPTPDEDESHSDFMDRCTDELEGEEDADERCQEAWDERSFRQASGEVHFKTHADDSKGLDFVLSDATPDRFGDTIAVEGWQLEHFNRNPIALFSHDPKFIVGRWKNLRVESKGLRGTLELAPEGTSERIDEIRRLVQAGILKAVSVGFKPRKREKLNDDSDGFFGPFKYLEQELVETSLVAVPANPNALAVVKSLNISHDMMDRLRQAWQGSDTVVAREFSAMSGKSQHREGKGKPMSGLAQRIETTQAQLVGKRDELDAHWAGVDNSDVADGDIEKANKLTGEIAALEKQLASMQASEKILAGTTVNGGGSHQRGNGGTAIAVYHAPAGNGRDPEATAAASPAIIKERSKSENPADYFWRSVLVAYAAKSWSKSQDEARAMLGREFAVYANDSTRSMCDLVLRAATAPAITTVVGWAAELAQQTYAAPMELLMPNSILNRLAPKGMSMTFGRAGKINIPTRSRTPTISGSFVGEGAPIPVRIGAFTSQTLVPKKLAVITTFTREMGIHSTPAIEGVLRQAIQDDTTVAVDTVLIDANPATGVRPPGLLNGVTVTTATAGGGFAALVGDISKLSGALTSSTYGNVRAPVWLMNPIDMNAAKFIVAPNTGEFVFRDELNRGQLNGWPVIDSATVPAKTVIAVDAADFVTTTGETLFDTSDQATLHEEDTSPQPLAAVGTPAVVAAPQRSLWQTDSIGLRMIMDLNWLMRRTGMVAWTQNVTWS